MQTFLGLNTRLRGHQVSKYEGHEPLTNHSSAGARWKDIGREGGCITNVNTRNMNHLPVMALLAEEINLLAPKMERHRDGRRTQWEGGTGIWYNRYYKFCKYEER